VISIKVDIVGGSLGGLSTAISLKEQDPSIKVIVHEKYKEIGYNHEGRRCGEVHTVMGEWTKWKPQGRSVFNNILNADVTIGKKHYQIQIQPGIAYTLNRQEFICQLARNAENKGAEVHTDDNISSLDDLDGDYIVDASGCPSSLKRKLGLKQEFVGSTYQQTLQAANCFIADTMKIIFTSYLGYFWIFPRNPEKKEVNIGIGTLGTFGYHLKEILEQFKEDNKVTGTVNYVVGGLVPLGLQHPLRYRNIIFVGDAGVGAFPLSGQGIYRALMSGEIAGRCIASGKPNTYPSLIHQEFLKWDMIGAMFIKMNLVFRKINPELFFTSINMITRSGKRLNPLTSY
jgi:flavin-dependent dehydrogenase